MHPFRFGVQFSTSTSGDVYRETVRKIEDLGYSTVFCPDHFDDQWAPTVALTVAAEATTTLRVAALVYDVDYRHPVTLAKEIATLDVVSGGRVEFGIGAGWMTDDYEAAGIQFDRPGVRIDRMIEAIEVVQGLWSGEPLDFRGSHYEISGLTGTPSPHQPGGPPIIVGGGGKRVLTEAALRADIVGLNASLHAGSVGPETALSALGERFLERRNWVEEAAGDRFPEIELQMNTFMTAVTNTTSEANEMFEGMAPMFGLSAEQARTIPMVLAGTISDVCDQLHRYRELYGTSYWVIHEGEVDAMAPVVAKMTDI
ncbi:MAG: TIGR03621 family F420-dependent LLM class oxidoreductase [Acidimicrobiales bacterium]|jgi:probable F420-dependent oxidoreductase|nr:TIGR03621 family F420-dependent LLM class oxidoreductase [Acidimicrobiales bacterium]MDP6901134.1 TIGR03621 family F420-dependent LLM class oxidoreductase [Acidimicrobiales bacterium]HJL98098.1 TIGR03621 family F420-dependent LLM class oxidoreductase [Acidimicrobiales bacterium]